MARRLDASLVPADYLEGKTVAVIGYGNQGRAQALNLRDSGVNVVIGQRLRTPSPQRGEGAGGEGRSQGWDKAIADGFSPLPIPQATRQADIAMLTLSDEVMGDVFAAEIEPHLQEGQTLLFSHGFAVVYRQIIAPSGVNVGLVSPKGQARGVRGKYLEGSGVPALIGVEQGDAMNDCLAYARACGYARALLLETTFKAETETDLFGEQAVLCGGLIELVQAGFQTLVDAGYDPELAYFECVHETKLIVDLLVERGLSAMRAAISDTAEFGGDLVGSKVIGEPSKVAMRDALGRIQSGEFAGAWLDEARDGKPVLTRNREMAANSAIQESWAALFGSRPLLGERGTREP